ncbi:MAG TPA: outer membrane beta-barrel protein [Puia sp.]|nr:outer membrane beta-barrel protein [Puia sp.]
MKKLKIFLGSIMILCSLFSFAQKGTSFIGVSGGISLPTGNWAKANYIVSTTGYVSDPSGFAASGIAGELNGAYFFSPYFGIGGLINYATYKTKDINTLSAGYRESFDVDQVTTTAGSYKIENFLAGIYFNYPVAKRLSLTARALAGIAHATTPLYTVDVEDGGIDDGTFEQKSASKTAFAFDIGAGLSYPIINTIAINLRADYFYAKPDFSIENTQRQNAAGRYVTEYDQPLAGVNVSLGVAWLIIKK